MSSGLARRGFAGEGDRQGDLRETIDLEPQLPSLASPPTYLGVVQRPPPPAATPANLGAVPGPLEP
jgi:hypothetical protein